MSSSPKQAQQIRKVNVRYHDIAADSYDAKWGIDFGTIGQTQVLGKLDKLLGSDSGPFEKSLEIGAGTGYFSLNLLQAGTVKQATCSDISPGMMQTLQNNAKELGLSVKTVVSDAEKLPFPDESFDLVFGHAVLHHIPDLAQAFREFSRVLKPGGTIAFFGEPSKLGDTIATVPKQSAKVIAPVWRRVVGANAKPKNDSDSDADNLLKEENELERFVDVHAFTPGQLSEFATQAGLEKIHVRGEELTANWFGWINRSLEATAEASELPKLWFKYAYHGYLALQKLDSSLLEPRLPAEIFYNLMISAQKA